jgi:hypothetical protein
MMAEDPVKNRRWVKRKTILRIGGGLAAGPENCAAAALATELRLWTIKRFLAYPLGEDARLNGERGVLR